MFHTPNEVGLSIRRWENTRYHHPGIMNKNNLEKAGAYVGQLIFYGAVESNKQTR